MGFTIKNMDDPLEKLDLVNRNDEVIGVILRKEVLTLEQTKKGFVRAVGLFLINNKGQLCIPIRSLDKKIAPGGYDFSMGEHVTSKETYVAAVIRGMKEEMSIDIDASALKEIGTIPPYVGMPYFHKIYLYPSDLHPTYNSHDYSSITWTYPQELLQKLEDGARAKGILKPSLKLMSEVRG